MSNDSLKYAIAVFILALAFNALFLNSPGFPEAAVGAHKVVTGGVLYRDSWEMHAPGEFYLWAFLFKIFGETLAVQKAAAAVANALSAGVFFLIASRLLRSRKIAFFLSLAYAVLFLAFPGELFITHVTYVALFNLLGLLFALEFISSGKLKWLFAAGAAFGVEMVFKQNAGPFSLAALLIFIFVNEARGNGKLAEKALGFLKKTAAAVAGFALPILPVAAYFYSKGALGDLVAQLFLNNFTNYVSTEAVAPALTAPIWFFTEVFAAAIALALFARNWKRRDEFLLLSLNGLLSLLIAYPRYADAALLNSLPALLLCISLAVLTPEAKQLVERIRFAISRNKALALVALALLLFNGIVLAEVGAKTTYRSSRLAGYVLHGNYTYFEYSDVGDYIRNNVPAGETIFVWGYYPDVYLYSMRNSPKHSFFLPNAIAGPRQAEIIAELEQKQIRFIAFKRGAECERGTKSGVFEYTRTVVDCREIAPDLYAYIQQNYAPITEFPPGFELFERK